MMIYAKCAPNGQDVLLHGQLALPYHNPNPNPNPNPNRMFCFTVNSPRRPPSGHNPKPNLNPNPNPNPKPYPNPYPNSNTNSNFNTNLTPTLPFKQFVLH